MNVVRLLEDGSVIVAVLALLAAVLRRSDIEQRSSARILIGTTIVLTAWYAAVSALAINDTFKASLTVRFPALPLAVLLPMLIAFVILSKSATARKLIDTTPLWWLVAIQAYRVLGFEFVALWAKGELPAVFALPAGFGDILTGLLAIAVALAASRDPARARSTVLMWNVIGITDFLVAMSTGFLSSPGKFQMLALSHPNLSGSVYPLVMIPAFLVPLSFMLHGLCLWKLSRSRARQQVDKPALAGA